jgi:hypothetical protein
MTRVDLWLLAFFGAVWLTGGDIIMIPVLLINWLITGNGG